MEKQLDACLSNKKIFNVLLLILTGWISPFHKKLQRSKIRNITPWENPIHVVLRFWQMHLWRLREGMAAFNIYMLGIMLKCEVY